MAENRGFRDLRVWQRGMDLVIEVYRATDALPKSEDFNLKSQIRRSAVSVPSNIAEGWGRNTRNNFRQFCLFARGSLCELQSQIELCGRMGLLEPTEVGRLTALADDLAASLFRFVEGLNTNVARETVVAYGAEDWFAESKLAELFDNPLV